MPLSKRARVEVYLPAGARWGRLRTVLEREFLYTFGGCTVISGLTGSYMNAAGARETEFIDLIYADTPFNPDDDLAALSQYADQIKNVVLRVTGEESVLIVVQSAFHSV